MKEHAVVVVGAGPTGLTLAGELALGGADVAIVERRNDQTLQGSRALGLSARTIEVFDQRGIAERFLREGQKAQVAGFAVVRLDISEFPTRHNYGLALRQKHVERILADWIEELGVPVYRGRALTTFEQDDTGVSLSLSDGSRLRAHYLVGCDGGRSLVRKTAGIEFTGWDATTSNILAEAEMTEEPPLGVHRTARGMHAFGREEYEIRDGKVVYAKEGAVGIMVTEPDASATTEPSLEYLRELLIATCGTDYGVHDLKWISRFSDASRQAASYRQGRVLLAGDAAHVHSPIGGQGMNLGIQDAVNLGWKLAQVVNGVSPDSLLDTYEGERHPVGARVLRTTMAQVALQRTDDRTQALRDIVGDLLAFEEPRKHMAAELSGLGIRYDLGGKHPLVGHRMPDLDLTLPHGSVRVYSLLNGARGVLLDLGAEIAVPIAPWSHRIDLVRATFKGEWTLPALGPIAPPLAVLIRPDGYVAWVDGEREALGDVIGQWFGAHQSR